MPEQLAFNMDCLEAMRSMPDKAFDLAVVDPPYGGGFTEEGGCKGWFTKYNRKIDHLHSSCRENEKERIYNRIGGKDSRFERYKKDSVIDWDVAPPEEYFDQLFRVSKNCIIWGGNYFQLPPTRCFLIWRKLTISESFSMAMVEYAWTSFNDNAKLFEYQPQDPSRFHPTQKPVALYKWILNRYAKPGDKILDTHLGSGSSRIAAYDLGFDFVGYEIDKEYFDKQEERFAKHTAQLDLFH